MIMKAMGFVRVYSGDGDAERAAAAAGGGSGGRE